MHFKAFHALHCMCMIFQCFFQCIFTNFIDLYVFQCISMYLNAFKCIAFAFFNAFKYIFNALHVCQCIFMNSNVFLCTSICCTGFLWISIYAQWVQCISMHFFVFQGICFYSYFNAFLIHFFDFAFWIDLYMCLIINCWILNFEF